MATSKYFEVEDARFITIDALKMWLGPLPAALHKCGLCDDPAIGVVFGKSERATPIETYREEIAQVLGAVRDHFNANFVLVICETHQGRLPN